VERPTTNTREREETNNARERERKDPQCKKERGETINASDNLQYKD